MKEIHEDFIKFAHEIQGYKEKVGLKLNQLEKKSDLYSKNRVLFTKIKSFEKLVLVLALLIPQNPAESKEDLTEMQKCFEIVLKHEILASLSSKRVKRSEDQEYTLEEALNVLFDFLISLLARQNSTLRDVTNIFFKAFSG